jgi:hypothetical protein
MAEREERTPHPEAAGPPSSENGNGAVPTNGASPDGASYVQKLVAVGNLAPWQLAKLALGEEPDEIVPSIEAVTFFEGTVAREFEESNAGQSIVEFRRDRAKRRGRRLP